MDHDLIHRAHAGDRKTAAGLAQLLAYRGDERVRVSVRPHRPNHRTPASHKSGHAVGSLRLRNSHLREGILVQPVIVRIAHDADDLPGRFHVLWSNALSDNDLLTDRILFGPIFLCHAFIDQHYAGCTGHITVGEVAAVQDWNPENIEVSR